MLIGFERARSEAQADLEAVRWQDGGAVFAFEVKLQRNWTGHGQSPLPFDGGEGVYSISWVPYGDVSRLGAECEGGEGGGELLAGFGDANKAEAGSLQGRGAAWEKSARG